MYESLKKNSNNFHLFIFAFDKRSYELLNKLNLSSSTVISLSQFEDEKLLKIKHTRTQEEYCWTCTPSIIKFCIENYNLDSCTYLDADLYFFSNPNILLREFENKSILITEHRYTPEYDNTSTSGIYNVQFLSFRNDTNGMKALNWWRDECIKWCFNKIENGKLGDQKYLDDWTSRFHGVQVLQHKGGGVAPWNIQQYRLEKKPFELIFFHFHGFKFLPHKKVYLGAYRLRQIDIKLIYKIYLIHLEKIKYDISLYDNIYDYHGTYRMNINGLFNIYKYLKLKYFKSQNVYDIDFLLNL